MEKIDQKRFLTYKHYAMLHEFTAKDADQEATLEERSKARIANMSKLAKEI